MTVKMIKQGDILEADFLDYKLQYIGSLDSGNFRTNILDKESKLVKVIQTTRKSRHDMELWLTHVYDATEGKIDMTWQPYHVDLNQDMVETEVGGKHIVSLRKHEDILAVILEDLAQGSLFGQDH